MKQKNLEQFQSFHLALARDLAVTDDLQAALEGVIKHLVNLDIVDGAAIFFKSPRNDGLRRSARIGFGSHFEDVTLELPSTSEFASFAKSNILSEGPIEKLPGNLAQGLSADGFKHFAMWTPRIKDAPIAHIFAASCEPLAPATFTSLFDGFAVFFTSCCERLIRTHQDSDEIARLRFIFRNSKLGIALTDIRGRFLQTNPAMQEMLGFSNDDFKKFTALQITHKEDLAAEQQRIRDQLATKSSSPSVAEKRYVTKEGTTFWARQTTSFTYDSNGRPKHALGFVEDINQIKKEKNVRERMDEKAQSAQKLESLGILAGGIAHDFNNLLMGILGNADLALRDIPPDSHARSNVIEIEKTAWRAAELSRQMLAYSGRGRFIVDSVNMNEIIADMRSLIQSSISKKANLHEDLAENLPIVKADVAQLRQVIVNLLTNASDAHEGDVGNIFISTGVTHCDEKDLSDTYLAEKSIPGRYVYIEVRDEGCGMTKHVLDRIFDPFFTTRFTGRGLGLAAVLGIVRGHDGAIKLTSTPNRGTTIRILFPAGEQGEYLQPTEVTPQTAGVDANWSGSGTILLVDDEETVRTVGKLMLEQLGFDVLLASDGAEAISIFKEFKPEIRAILLDLTMPIMNGEEAFRKLREISPTVRIVLSTGYSENDAYEMFAPDDLRGFISKPYRLSTLEEVLYQALSDIT